MTIGYFETRDLAEKEIAKIKHLIPGVNIEPIKVMVWRPDVAKRKYGMIFHVGAEPYCNIRDVVPFNATVWILSDENGEMPTALNGAPLYGMTRLE